MTSDEPTREPDEVERLDGRPEDEPRPTVEAEDLEPPGSGTPEEGEETEEPDPDRPTPAPRRRGAIDGFF